ncbi:hypothetical protein MMC15_005789 [Xylographa vitiligo]|nr:hypothetical protein [Xylographa vitiligo]
MLVLVISLLALIRVSLAQGYTLPNDLSYHNTIPHTDRSFQGVYSSNFNETITFCNFKAKAFEVFDWTIIPVIAQSADSGQFEYNEKGALLYGGAYVAANGSIIWKGLGFSANGPYDAAFALGKEGKNADGYYTFLAQKNESTPAGETGPWLLYYRGEPTEQACALVYRTHNVSAGVV